MHRHVYRDALQDAFAWALGSFAPVLGWVALWNRRPVDCWDQPVAISRSIAESHTDWAPIGPECASNGSSDPVSWAAKMRSQPEAADLLFLDR